MDQNTWEIIDPVLDELAEEIERLLTSDEASKIRELLSKLSEKAPAQTTTELNCVISIFDSRREVALPLLNMGFGVSEFGEVYPTSGDSSPHRYVVDGEIQVVPHDICPKCYREWDFKFENPHCLHCDSELGVNCWALLDSDVCPSCENGKISAASPKCESCGYAVNPKFVRWG